MKMYHTKWLYLRSVHSRHEKA